MVKIVAALALFVSPLAFAQVPTTALSSAIPESTLPKSCWVAGGQAVYCPSNVSDSGTQILYNGQPLSVEVSAPFSISLAKDAAKQGVLLDAFKESGDADDTASLNRAMAACVPVALGARTYTINNFNSGTSCAAFILKGIKGQSVIQRTSASNGTFFAIGSATVYIDGVTFDANKSSVSANQWGVLLSRGGQNVIVQNSVFKNNSGSLGSCFSLLGTGPAAGGWFNFSNNEVTGCAFNPLFLGSVYQGMVTNNYIHDNSGGGIWAGSFGTPSSMNYLSDVVISGNLIVRNSGAGLALTGGFSVPYTYGTPGALRVNVVGNYFQDNGGSGGYQLSLQGDYLNAIGNQFDQSSPSVPVFGGIDCNARYEKIESNTITLSGSSFGIDCGGSVGASIARNTITLTTGGAIDAGGNQDTVVSDNLINLSGTASAIGIINVEGDGSSGEIGAFPTVTSDVIVKRNRIVMNGSGTRGITLLDNAGGTAGASPVQVVENDFVGENSAASLFAISYQGSASSIQIGRNTWQGTSVTYVDPIGNGDVIFNDVFDEVRGFSSTANVRSILTPYVENYGAGESVLYINPTSGGNGYTNATVITVTCPGFTGWTGNAQINNGAIIGVRTLSVGSGCTGTPTAAASDSGGGTGAVLAVGNLAALPAYRKITWYSYTAAGAGNRLAGGGGYIGLSPNQALFSTGPLNLDAVESGLFWAYDAYTLQSYAVGSLPTCNASTASARIYVSGSTVNGWLAQCDGTNWRWPDGTIVS